MILFAVWLRNVCTTFTVTDQRIKLKKGIIFRRVDEIEIYRVKDTKADYSLLNGLFNIGTVTILSSDAATKDGALQLRYIPDPTGIRETIRNAVEQGRRRRGIREFDFDRVSYAG